MFDQQGWVVGDFPNVDFHMRSLVNGQDSTVCPSGEHLTKYPSVFSNGNFNTPGGLHCAARRRRPRRDSRGIGAIALPLDTPHRQAVYGS